MCCCLREVLAVQYIGPGFGANLWLALLNASTGAVIWNVDTGVVAANVSRCKGIGINSVGEILTAVGKFYDLDGNHLRTLTSSIPTLNAAGLSVITSIATYNIFDLCFDAGDRIYLYDRTFDGAVTAGDLLTCAALRFNAAGSVQDRHFYAGAFNAAGTTPAGGGFFYAFSLDTAGICLLDPAAPSAGVVFCGYLNRRFTGPTYNTDWQWKFDNPNTTVADQRATVTSSGSNRSASLATPFLRHTAHSVKALSTGNVVTGCSYYNNNGANNSNGHRLLLTNPGTGVPAAAVDITALPYATTFAGSAPLHVAVGRNVVVFCSRDSGGHRLVRWDAALDFEWYTQSDVAGGVLATDVETDDCFLGGSFLVERFHGPSGCRLWQTHLGTALGMAATVRGLAYRRLF